MPLTHASPTKSPRRFSSGWMNLLIDMLSLCLSLSLSLSLSLLSSLLFLSLSLSLFLSLCLSLFVSLKVPKNSFLKTFLFSSQVRQIREVPEAVLMKRADLVIFKSPMVHKDKEVTDLSGMDRYRASNCEKG